MDAEDNIYGIVSTGALSISICVPFDERTDGWDFKKPYDDDCLWKYESIKPTLLS